MRRKNTGPTTRPLAEHVVENVQEQVRTAKSLQSVAGRDLLDDADTNPAVFELRSRLSHQRQEALLRQRHKAELRRQERDEFDAELDDRGHRLIRRRELADSPARKAALLQRLQRWVIAAAVPAIVGLGATSTAAVHAFMVDYAGAAAWASWGTEPALMTLVAGTIITRAVMAMAGAALPPSVAWIERGALAASVVMAGLGGGIGAIIAPIGAAVVALTVERIMTAIRAADPAAPQDAGTAATARPVAEALPQREQRDPLGRDVDAGIEALDVYLTAAAHTGEPDAPTEPTERTERSHAEPAPDTEVGSEDAGSVSPLDTPSEHRVSGVRSHRDGTDDEAAAERLLTAQERRRMEGERNRARVAEFLDSRPSAPTAEVAEALSLGESTVRRIRKDLESGGAP